MKLQFDANQNFQIKAIDSITGIFEGQPLEKTDLSFHIDEQNS
ncbi:unnamed protein product, partial [marine sediment metagenome]